MPTVINLRDQPDPRDAVHRAVQALVEGKVVALPTDTVYGLAASALKPEAVEAIYEIKGRSFDAPLALSVTSGEAAVDFLSDPSPLGLRLLTRATPGPITLVLPGEGPQSAVTHLPDAVRKRVIGPGGCVGFRIIRHRVIEHVHRLMSAPLVLTSANVSGSDAPTNADGVMEQFGDASPERLPLVLDDGPTRYGGASTVVRVQSDRYEILRPGAVEAAAIAQYAKPIITIVCTGNTCRSPMAETLLNDLLARKLGRDDAAFVVSAGLAAGGGSGASPAAVEVMGRRKLDLTGHCSRPLDDEMMRQSDVVLTMTRGHRRAILAAWPMLSERVHTLRHDGGDVTDPVGSPVEVYEACAEQIEHELEAWIDLWRGGLLPSV